MKLILLMLLFLPLFAAGQIITTIAGIGTAGFSGDGGPATAAQLRQPYSVVLDARANVYFADNYNGRIRKIITSTGIINTVVGTGDSCVPTVSGVPATAVSIGRPPYVGIDDTGNLYVGGCGTEDIGKISVSTGLFSTISTLYCNRLVVDRLGNLYFLSGWGIMKMASGSGIVSWVAGNGTTYGFSGDGGPATNALLSTTIFGLAVDASNNVYVCDAGNERIREISASTGIINTIAGNGSVGYSGDGYPAISAEFDNPMGLAVSGTGNVYIADYGNNVVRRIDARSGIIATIAGNGRAGYGPDGVAATASQLNFPTSVAVDGEENVYISDFENNRIRKITNSNLSVKTIPNQFSPANIYPNPAVTKITISSSAPIYEIAITNLLGQTIYTNNYHSETIQVDVSTLPPGVYLVKINGTEVRKFVKE